LTNKPLFRTFQALASWMRKYDKGEASTPHWESVLVSHLDHDETNRKVEVRVVSASPSFGLPSRSVSALEFGWWEVAWAHRIGIVSPSHGLLQYRR